MRLNRKTLTILMALLVMLGVEVPWSRFCGFDAAVAQPVQPVLSGAATYQSRCAQCHDHPEVAHAPTRAALGEMSAQSIEYALTQGKMQGMGAGLTAENRAGLIEYLRGSQAPAVTNAWADKMMCPAGRSDVDLDGPATVSTFGYDVANTRTLSARAAGLTKAQLSNLELAWVIAIPQATTMRSQPAIVGNTVFWPVADARAMYAFDVSVPMRPCIKWIYKAASLAPLRTSASYGVLADGRAVVAFAGFDSTLYLLDAKTGMALWTKKVGTYNYSFTTGTPVLLKDRVIVPVSQYEISVAGQNARACCTNHGYVLSLDPKDGAQQWRYDTMPEAQAIRDRGDGKKLYGPSGAPIWNSPSIDEKRGLIFFGTGEANSPPATKNTDAIIAIGLADGKERWSRQGTDKDIYLSGCGPHPRPDQYNCVSDTVYRDVDFGASMVLAHLGAGQDVVFAGQKSGAVWALDRGSGDLLWRNDLGSGSPLGGVHWGMTYANGLVYAPISLVKDDFLGQKVDTDRFKSGLYALDAKTGAIKWLFATHPDCSGDRKARMPTCGYFYGFSAAPALIDGALIEGSLDGFLYVLDATNGALLWKFDTAISYQGINGVAGNGGSIDAAAITAANGLLLVNSGYGMFGETPGNVILAFRPKGHP